VARRRAPRPLPITSPAQRYRVYRRWRRWLARIRAEITRLAIDRHIYKEVLAIVRANPAVREAPGDFLAWMRRLYIESTTITLRRLVDRDKRTISFVRLMSEIADHPEVLSRDRFVRLYPPHLRERVAHHDFNRFCRPGAMHVGRSIINGHQRRLGQAQRRLRNYVNRHVAHADRRPMRWPPTFEELDVFLDLLEELLTEYVLLLEGKSLSDILPVPQYDWKAPFRVAWIQEQNVFSP
jgi:hypothetical protein